MGGLCTGRRSDARFATFPAVRRPSIVFSDVGKPARAALGTLLTFEEVGLALRASQELRSRSHEFRVLGFWDSARKKFVHDKVFRKRCTPAASNPLPASAATITCFRCRFNLRPLSLHSATAATLSCRRENDRIIIHNTPKQPNKSAPYSHSPAPRCRLPSAHSRWAPRIIKLWAEGVE
ncbi:hypothetical protein K523DRAFT_98947 [Schizophyllum commune Tattone D]|nr:hypothetical protein K523DRAFT_98947 [Schizophyllum commune Tattone D]